MHWAHGRFLVTPLVSKRGLSVALFPPAGMMGDGGSSGFPGVHTAVGLSSPQVHGCLGRSWTSMGSIHFSPNHPTTLSQILCADKVGIDSISFLSCMQMKHFCNKPGLCLAGFVTSFSSCSNKPPQRSHPCPISVNQQPFQHPCPHPLSQTLLQFLHSLN